MGISNKIAIDVLLSQEMRICSIKAVVDFINQNAVAIINNLDKESIDVYNFLQKEFQQSDVEKNLVFQFLFRSFYRLDNAGLTPDFKSEYFRIMQEERSKTVIDLESALDRLYNFKNRQDNKSFQFSFVTKLFNTIDNSLPIYDSEVARVFGLCRPYQKDFKIKYKRLKEQLDLITEAYNAIISENLVHPAISLFDSKFKNHQLSDMKRLDFIVWSAGKVMSKEQQEKA
ncbi:hypothetical protein EFA69_02660 [Rufibacter immobilis]|uniref:Uncharacterized protein n=1 Tax=Rufibacter immobilis TaxID=1348778 RepID=A0A3M9N4K2_9BACT|nr:hypothetical protein [Rufibacter immobilis]RNI32247.1 hypothetical protein EFA69_02660 [Rufibacter immobilis]